MSGPDSYPIEKQQPYVWPVNPDTAKAYNEIVGKLRYEAPESVEALELIERLRELPGYPMEFEAVRHEGYYLKPVLVGFSTVRSN